MIGQATCILEPRGDYGLEGYSRGESYQFERCSGPDHRTYYRVWPVTGDKYYETCGPKAFSRYFKEVT